MSLAPIALIIVSLTAMLSVSPTLPEGHENPHIEEWRQSYTFEHDGRIQIENLNGPITIQGWDQPEVEVRAVKKAKHAEDLAGAEIKATVAPSSLIIETEHKPTRHRWLGLGKRSSTASVGYELRVPRKSQLTEIKSTNGAILIKDVTGAIKVTTLNGPIVAQPASTSPEQLISLDSVNGPIDLAWPSTLSASIHAKSLNGTIANDFGLEIEKPFPIGSKMNGTIGSDEPVEVHIKTVNGRIHLQKSTTTSQNSPSR